ncbi:MAG: phenylalanine--tRNA ligase subunit alpha [Nocardioidaceae bacterium]
MSAGAELTSEIARLVQEAQQAALSSGTASELTEARRRFLGKSASLQALRRTIGGLEPTDRRTVGAVLNTALGDIETFYQVRAEALEDVEPALPVPLDVTLPAVAAPRGGLHPTIQLMYDLNDAFASLNFAVYEGPELSSEQFEFDKLNFPPDHPARESMDTFWLDGTDGRSGAERICLRPHLTGSSIRYMLEHEPPHRFVYPGRVYRNETPDARHERSFFQYEVLIVDRAISMTAGKFIVDTILDTVFGRPVRTRMRTGFFPFVEPGFEIDMECQVCGGSGCRTCHQVGWIELMPGGVPHPNVLMAAGLDPAEWNGFYVNVGLDRLTMMRYEIDDVRLMHSGDLRFLRQFS